ncbi:MAG TPA: N,N-dimethylformamidase beta subunit family domain-containing protein [Gaiellaceae bacterium]|nr:N,N-dimethylformamidase beta subunit family domain-containing protein [Gaiellaceae bacterium]
MARASLTAAAAVILCGLLSPAALADNAIQRENALPGTTAWQTRIGGRVDLYASPISTAPGQDVALHVSTPDQYRLNVYRLGWYGGTGARLVACLPACDANEQGVPQAQRQGLGAGAAGWSVTDVLHTGADWTSGYYLVEAVLAHGGTATAFFVLHDSFDAPASQIVVQVPVNTWQAYNTWGGASLYNFLGQRSTAISFDRPLGRFAQSPMWWEIQLVRFLEREGYDVSYQTDVDTDTNPASLLRHRLVIVAGHDEYWSSAMRDGFDAALAGGTNLAFLGSNDGYWNLRYADDRHTIISAKSLYDPNPVLSQKTAMFREIGRPECMLMGVQHIFFAPIPQMLNYVVPVAAAGDPWFANTGFQAGDTVVGVVGREHDILNPFPDSCIHQGLSVLFHYDGGGVDQNGDAVRFTAPSGARVFASGAQQFSWGLDDWRSDGSLFPEPPVEPWRGVPVDPRLQQFMRNALDDLTRPAPPANPSVRVVGDRVRVTVGPNSDPRLLGFGAFVRGGGRWVRVCAGIVTCVGSAPPGLGAFRVAVITFDIWHRHSAGAFVVLQRHA